MKIEVFSGYQFYYMYFIHVLKCLQVIYIVTILGSKLDFYLEI